MKQREEGFLLEQMHDETKSGGAWDSDKRKKAERDKDQLTDQESDKPGERKEWDEDKKKPATHEGSP